MDSKQKLIADIDRAFSAGKPVPREVVEEISQGSEDPETADLYTSLNYQSWSNVDPYLIDAPYQPVEEWSSRPNH